MREIRKRPFSFNSRVISIYRIGALNDKMLDLGLLKICLFLATAGGGSNPAESRPNSFHNPSGHSLLLLNNT